jgi:hypothetical protein
MTRHTSSSTHSTVTAASMSPSRHTCPMCMLMLSSRRAALQDVLGLLHSSERGCHVACGRRSDSPPVHAASRVRLSQLRTVCKLAPNQRRIRNDVSLQPCRKIHFRVTKNTLLLLTHESTNLCLVTPCSLVEFTDVPASCCSLLTVHLALKLQVGRFSETSVNPYHTRRRHNPASLRTEPNR